MNFLYLMYDQAYWLVIIGGIIGMLAQNYITSTYRKYDRIRNVEGWSGESIARKILNTNDLEDIEIKRSKPGLLTDHYDPRNRLVALSNGVYDGHSISAVAVASHEVGHALQHHGNYKFIAVRNAILPFAMAAGQFGMAAIVIGLLISPEIFFLGLVAFGITALFQLVTLPVEFDASKRALRVLRDNQYLNPEELAMAKKVLTAAALTYVAGLIASILNLLYYMQLGNRRNNR